MRGFRSTVGLAVLGLAACAAAPEASQVWLPEDVAGQVVGGQDRSPLVAVVDGGIDAEHPALRGKVVGRWTAPAVEGAPSAHGTRVAGIVAGAPAAGFPGGFAPGARLLDARALGERGAGDPEDIASALMWSVEQEADLIVASFGSETDHAAVRVAVAAAVAAGVVVVASTGNGVGDFDFFPAGYDGVVGVTAIGRDGKRIALANGRHADLAAPGKDVVAPTPGGGYESVSGTSVAAAAAAGIIAGCWEPAALIEAVVAGTRWAGETVAFPDRDVPRLACQP